MSGLLDAVRAGNLARVQRLIGEGATVNEVNVRGTNLLMFAVAPNHSSVVRWLLKTNGARISDVNNDGMTALSIAAINGHHSLVQWLLEGGGAKITDSIQIRGEYRSMRTYLRVANNSVHFTSLLKVMVLPGVAPADFIAKL
jgi:ankyrin repeat protein